MLHSDLFNYLKTTPQINDLFGGRIYHEWIPESETKRPALVFFLSSETEQAEDMEASEEADGDKLDLSNYQFDIRGRKSKEVTEAAKTFDSVFRRFAGTMGSTRIQLITLGNKSHLGEIVGDKMERRVSLDYGIFHDV